MSTHAHTHLHTYLSIDGVSEIQTARKGKWGEVGCYGGRWGEITTNVGLGWTGLVSTFPPISPHFSSGAFANAPPPHPRLVANQNHVF